MGDEPDDNYGARVRAARAFARLDEPAAAELLGFSRRTLDRIESNERQLFINEAKTLAAVTGVPLDFLLHGWEMNDGHDDNRRPAPTVETVEELMDQVRAMLAAVEQINGRLGRDLGRRDLRARGARGHRPEAPEADALTGG